jgi:hypothetical protein
MACFDPRMCQGLYEEGEVAERTNLMVAVWLEKQLSLGYASRTGPAECGRPFVRDYKSVQRNLSKSTLPDGQVVWLQEEPRRRSKTPQS